jgi:hypothetical protein
MSHDQDDIPTRPVRRPSAIGVIEKWGVVEAWLAGERGRMVIVSIGIHGLLVTVIDPSQGEQLEDVGRMEEPSAAALRAIGRFSTPDP